MKLKGIKMCKYLYKETSRYFKTSKFRDISHKIKANASIEIAFGSMTSSVVELAVE